MKKISSSVIALALVLGLVGIASAQSPSSFMTSTTSTTTTGTTGTTSTTTTGTGTTTNNTLMCIPQTQTAVEGSNVYFTATGGTGTYTWSVPEITLANPTGTSLWMNYGTPGLKTVTVRSGNQVATCLVTVTSLNPGGGFPGLPNTGQGGDVTSNLLWLLVGVGIVGGVTFLSYKGLTKDNL